MKRQFFRAWFYLRMGYSIYWAFAFMGINVMTVTYFLAIEKAPFLKEIFPSFVEYVIFLVIVGVPILVFTGFLHYKKVRGYASEAEVNTENNPYVYKLNPGYQKEVIFPFFLLVTRLLVKLANNEKLDEKDKKIVSKLEKQFDILLKGGYVGLEKRQVSFGTDKD